MTDERKKQSAEDVVADALEEVARGLQGAYGHGTTIRALIEAAAKVRAGQLAKKRRGKA